MMSTNAQVPQDHPLMRAWNAYKATPEYANSKSWAQHAEHIDGSLWALFMAGWQAAIDAALRGEIDVRTYVVWCPDLGQRQEDGATIPATDPADAAEGWAEWHDRSSAEYRIASGREEIVIVRDAETGEQREWIVRGEAMPYYTARIGESPTIRAQVAPGRWEGVPRRSEDNE